MTKSVRKRDGSLQDFEPDKIRIAISKAFSATGFEDPEASKGLSGIIISRIEQKFPNAIPHVEEIQDIVEHVLIEKGYVDVAKAYILYRQKRSEIRLAKRYLGVADDLKLSINAVEILKKRYLRKDFRGEAIETPKELFDRVARHISRAEGKFGGDPAIYHQDFLRMMQNLLFLPNSQHS